MRIEGNSESGFTVLETAIASLITMTGLVFLAGLFTLGMAQNRMVKQYTTAIALAQQKLEELNSIETSDTRLAVGGGLTDNTKQAGYFDTVFVDPDTGTITTNIPQGTTPIYDRYWSIEADPQLNRAVLVSVRAKARQPSLGRSAEETTLTTVRSW